MPLITNISDLLMTNVSDAPCDEYIRPPWGGATKVLLVWSKHCCWTGQSNAAGQSSVAGQCCWSDQSNVAGQSSVAGMIKAVLLV